MQIIVDDLKKQIFKKDRISTGIEDLDIALQGGYKHPGIVALLGHLIKEKDYLACSFLTSDTKNLYISTNKDISLIEECKEKGIKPNITTFLDCYSGKSGMQNNIIYLKSPSALNDIALEISTFLKSNKNGKIKIVINSFSDILFYNDLNAVLKFIQFMGTKMKENNATMLIVADPEIKKEQLNVILSSIDEIYEMKKIDNKIFLNSYNMPFEAEVIVNNGIILK